MKSLVLHIAASYVALSAGFLILVLRPLYPYHRVVAVLFFIASLAIFVITFFERKALIKQAKIAENFFINYWPHIILAAFLLFFAYLVWIIVPFRSTPFSRATNKERAEFIAQDTTSLIYLENHLETLIDELKNNLRVGQKNIELTRNEKESLKNTWQIFTNDIFELDIIKQRYKGFLRLNPRKFPEQHNESFLLAYNALLTQYKTTLDVHKLINGNTQIAKLLDEENINGGIPKNTYTNLKNNLTDPEQVIKINAARAYLKIFSKRYQSENSLFDLATKKISLIDDELDQFPNLLVSKPLDILERKAFTLWFPVQKKVATEMSYLRASDRDYFITPEILAKHKDKIEPGDIFLERRNWHITNVGIPGFWPHAAFYVGTLQEMDTYFAELKSLNGKKPSDYLKEKYPLQAKEFSGLDTDGLAYRVIEAKRPGVIFNSLEESANADSLSILRPKLTKEEKFQAITYAISQVGKPYDFNFDFATDNELVCSELVYKSYGNNKEIFPAVQNINGRDIVSPNDIAKKFAETYNTDRQLLEFVLFLGADEKNGTAIEKNVDEFLKSWERPKWYLFKN